MELQNNYTTVEQSKQLLELGLPPNSADCYISNEKIFVLHNRTFQENFNEDLDMARSHFIEMPYYIPCWSVGRLMDIFRICATIDVTLHIKSGYDENLVGGMIINLENMIENEELDFSKLN